MNGSYTIGAIFLSFVIALTTAGAFYFVKYQEHSERMEKIKTEIEELKSENAKIKTIQKDIKDFQEKIKKAEEEKASIQMDTPKLSEVVPKLLDSTETISNKFNIKFQDIRISPLVRAEDWSELPVEMTVLGTFNNICCFLNVMEKRQLVNLAAGSMNVSVSSEVDKDSKSPMLSVTLSAKVYILSQS